MLEHIHKQTNCFESQLCLWSRESGQAECLQGWLQLHTNPAERLGFRMPLFSNQLHFKWQPALRTFSLSAQPMSVVCLWGNFQVTIPVISTAATHRGKRQKNAMLLCGPSHSMLLRQAVTFLGSCTSGHSAEQALTQQRLVICIIHHVYKAAHQGVWWSTINLHYFSYCAIFSNWKL